MCFLLMRTTGLAFVGKGHQQTYVDQCCSCRLSKIDADAAREVCALESSSFEGRQAETIAVTVCTAKFTRIQGY